MIRSAGYNFFFTPHNFIATQAETEASALAKFSGCVPPAVAMSGAATTRYWQSQPFAGAAGKTELTQL